MSIVTEAGTEYETTPAALAGYATAQLLEIYNAFADKQLKSWNKAKSVLITRIVEEGNLSTELAEAPTEPVTEKEKPAKKDKPAKEKAPRKARALSKSFQMLDLVLIASEKNMTLDIDVAAGDLNTSVGSIRSYLSYFRKGQKNHPVVNIQVEKSSMYISDLNEQANAWEVLDAKKEALAA